MKNNFPTIVLIRPQLPENIGMAARAMDNNGFKKLILVSPREKWPNQIAINSSGNSKQIIKKAKIYQTIDKALSSFNYVFATSNRKRFLNKPFYKKFDKIFENAPLDKKIAIVFGPENSGLSNEDLMLCDSIINIELSKSNSSLNLSHAVLLITYKWTEIIKNKKITKKNLDKDLSNIASKKEFLNFMFYLKSQLQNVNFLYPKHKSKSMFNNIQTMFLRASLSKSEIQTLWGMIKKLSKTSKNT